MQVPAIVSQLQQQMTPLAWGATAAAVCLATLLLCLATRKRQQIKYRRTSINERVVSNVQRAGNFFPTFWLWGGAAQTIASSVLAQKWTPRVKFNREILKVKPLRPGFLNGEVAVDWCQAKNQESLPAEAPILIVLPGLSGSSRAPYIQALAGYLTKPSTGTNFRIVVFTNRGCGGVSLVTQQAYTAHYVDDFIQVIEHVQGKFPKAQLFGIGYSLGANILTNFVGGTGAKCPLTAAIACACPFDLKSCSDHLNSGRVGRFLSRHMTRALMRLVKKMQDPSVRVDGPDLLKEKNVPAYDELKKKVDLLSDYDELVTSKLFNYKDANAYYEAASSSQKVANIAIPMLFLNAVDDPVVDINAVPTHLAETNTNLIFLITKRGGHSMDWYTGVSPKPWSAKVVSLFLKAILEKRARAASLTAEQKH